MTLLREYRTPNLDWLDKPVSELPMPEENVVYVKTESELQQAITKAKPGVTIILKEGRYELKTTISIQTENITIRGETNDRSKVVLSGDGFYAPQTSKFSNSSGILVYAPDFTLANLTLKEFSTHALSIQGWYDTTPHNLHVYNVGFIDIGNQFFKVNYKLENGSCRPAPEAGVVEYCYFEQTRTVAADRGDGFKGNYIGGLDAHHVKDWIVRDNIFININGATSADAAIFIWSQSEGSIVERNLIIGSDEGIAFGNPHIPEHFDYHHKGGIIRNNMIYTRDQKIGIELVAAKDVKVYNNTIVNENTDYNLGIKYAHKETSVVIKNNLVSAGITKCPNLKGAKGELSNNLVHVSQDYFKDPVNGDLRLKESIAKVKDAGTEIDAVADDFYGNKRAGSNDIGAIKL